MLKAIVNRYVRAQSAAYRRPRRVRQLEFLVYVKYVGNKQRAVYYYPRFLLLVQILCCVTIKR